MRTQSFRRFSFSVAVLLASSLAVMLTEPNVSAQTSTAGKVIGTVTDPSGAVVPKAQVQLINVGTSAALTAMADDSGGFNFPAVPPGTYRLTVTLAGFRTAAVTDI